jgi:heterodisulfide reductase subunit B/heterodisulfide reductase subunit C
MKQPMNVFWGCLLIHNYPFFMTSTKAVLDAVGVALVDVPEFGCCPDPIFIRAYGEDASLTLSARNIAIARKKGKQLLVVCNGCYSVLHEAKGELDDPVTRKAVNERLPEDAQYPGGLEVVHLLSLLNSKLPILKTEVKKPLTGIKVAVHYGCHAIYPPAVSGDDPRKPSSMDDLVTSAGAVSVDYESKLDCCGTPVAMFDKDEGDALLKKKLADIKNARADCIVTSCPSCFMRFDTPPAELKDEALPVLHITELLGLAMGIPASEIFPVGHSTTLKALLQKIEAPTASEKELIERHFDCSELSAHCEACREECTAAISTRNSDKPFNPLAPVENLLAGKYHEAINDPEVWRCLQCGKCLERCPNNLGLKDFYAKLRELSIAEGKSVRLIEDKIKLLEETGYGMPKRKSVRWRMGLDLAPDVDSAPIKKILDNVREKRKNDQ